MDKNKNKVPRIDVFELIFFVIIVIVVIIALGGAISMRQIGPY